MSDIIKIYGLPRSCTNVTETIIQKNFNLCLYNNWPCWKHGENTIQGRSLHLTDPRGREVNTDELIYVVCTKNPYDWLYSLFCFEKSTKNKKQDAWEFLKGSSWHYTKTKSWNRQESNAIDVFNYLTRHWLSLDNVFQISHDHIIGADKQIDCMKRLEKSFNLSRKHNDILPMENIIKPRRIEENVKYEYKPSVFNKSQIDYISDNLDEEVVKLAGYELR